MATGGKPSPDVGAQANQPRSPSPDVTESPSSPISATSPKARPARHRRPSWTSGASHASGPSSTTEELHALCVDAAAHLAAGEFGDLGLPSGALQVARASLAADPPPLHGRFDLRYDGTGPAKPLEYNADTPTGLVESSIAQWYRLTDTHADLDQWNSFHERLVLAWRGMRDRLPDAPVWFAHHEDEETGEELMTATYLRDTCEQAGLPTASITMGMIGYVAVRRCFVDDAPLYLLQALPLGEHARRGVLPLCRTRPAGGLRRRGVVLPAVVAPCRSSTGTRRSSGPGSSTGERRGSASAGPTPG